MKAPTEVGQRVRFTGAFLRSTCSYTGPLGQLRGTVVSVKSYPGYKYVRVLWDQHYFDEQETSVLSTNLQVTK